VRALAKRLAAALPYPGLPVASTTAAEGCAQVADDAVALEVAALLLVTYAGWVARRN
jgi:hypothetical protein